MNFHSNIRDAYGKDCLDNIRHLEKTGKKIARYRNHLRFSLHCKHQKITPVSLRLSSTVKGTKADNILRRAERSLLNVRIGQIVHKLDVLSEEKHRIDHSLNAAKIPADIKAEVKSRCERAQLKEHELSKYRQQQKFARLVERKNDVNTVKKGSNIASECIAKWVKNCSDRLLNDSELSVLVKGLNFAVTPRELPIVDIVTSTESACRKLSEGDASELRAKVVNLLSRPNTKNIDSNLSNDERKALQQLQKDKDIKILPADKGRLVVVLNTVDYHSKCEKLLGDSKTYKNLGTKDPTSKYKKELVSVLQDLEKEGGINRVEYRKLYPTTESPPKFYGLPKVHKKDTPLRPIVSSVGTITYNCAKLLAEILSPLVGKTVHHVANSQDFAKRIVNERVEEDEELRSYDVTALFTSVPVDKALTVIQACLEQDHTLCDRTSLSAKQVTKLLEVCLKCTYFVYNGVYYQQIHGAAMGSPVSPIVCNLYMEDLEQKAIQTAPHPPLWWYRFVDDTHTKLKKQHAEEFTNHLNSLDPDIKFTTEGEEDRALAFLDTYTVIQDDGSLKIKIYRKPTHTDQYLNFHSNHPVQHKLGVIQTLHHRADSVITDPVDQESEKLHINNALKKCGYPNWSFDKAAKPKTKPPSKIKATIESKGQVVMPYIKGTSEAIKRTFGNYGVKVAFKPTQTLRQLLVAPKDKTEKKDVAGPVYYIPCQGKTHRGPCKESYIGETERSLKTRFLEHRRPSSTSSEVSQHIDIESPGHHVDLNQVKILDREPRSFERGVKEAIYIRVNKPSLNKDRGRYKLPRVFDPILESRVKKVIDS